MVSLLFFSCCGARTSGDAPGEDTAALFSRAPLSIGLDRYPKAKRRTVPILERVPGPPRLGNPAWASGL